MRICFLAPEFIPNWGGTGTYTINLLRHLPRHLDIHVVTVRRKMGGQYVNPRSTEEITEYLGRSLAVHYMSVAEDTFVYNMGFQISCFRELPKLVKQYHFDVIHSHHCHMPDLYLQLTKRARIPTVTTVHDFLGVKRANIRRSGLNFRRLDRSEKAILAMYPFLRFCEVLYIRSIPMFISPSRYIERTLISSGARHGQICVIPNGVDTSIFHAANVKRRPDEMTQNPRPTVLFTGRLVSHKGIDTIVRAIPIVVRSVPDVRFLFTGPGLPTPYLNDLRTLGVSDEAVEFMGYIKDYFQMAHLYSLASVFVLPSLFENCPMSVLEAMSCGVPVIASNVGGIPEIIESGKNGILLSPRNSVALAESIVRLLNDERYASRLAQEGRRTIVDKFSAEKMAARTAQLYGLTAGQGLCEAE